MAGKVSIVTPAFRAESTIGPAVASGIFEAQGVYWLGPILGGVAAALLYDSLFLRRGREPVDHGAVSPEG